MTARFGSALLALTFALDVVGGAHAGTCTPPPNEECDGAMVIPSASLPFEFTAPLGCVNDIPDKPYFDVFFRFDCTCSGEYRFDLCESSGDTYIRLYTGACGWSGGTEFAVGDDECPSSPPNADPQIDVALEAGTTYWVEVGTWRPDPPWAPPLNSPYTLRVSVCTDPCPFDVDGDGAVGFSDLLDILTAWGPCAGCPEDLDGNGSVGFGDILDVLTNWGPC